MHGCATPHIMYMWIEKNQLYQVYINVHTRIFMTQISSFDYTPYCHLNCLCLSMNHCMLHVKGVCNIECLMSVSVSLIYTYSHIPYT